MQRVIKTNKVTMVSDQDKSMISQSEPTVDEHEDYLSKLLMRPLVDFKKLPVKEEGQTLQDGISKYKESKQKEGALESLNDENIETILNGQSQFKRYKKA